MTKIIFIIPHNDRYMAIFVSNLISLGILDPSSVIYLKYRSGSGVNYVPSKGNELSDEYYIEDLESGVIDFESVSKIISLSLVPDSAYMLKKIVGKYGYDVDNIFVLTIDNEIKRWRKSYHKNKKVSVDKGALIDDNVQWVLGNIDNYFTQKNSGVFLEGFLGRKLNVHDRYALFPIMNYEKQNEIKSLIDESIASLDKNEKRILVFTKPLSRSLNRKILWALLVYLFKAKDRINFKLGLWFDPFRGVEGGLVLILMIKFFSKLKGHRIDLELLKPMIQEKYYITLNEYNYLIAQDRGGASALREFCRNGGQVIFKKSEPNYQLFVDEYSVKVPCYKSFVNAFEKIDSSDAPVSNSHNLTKSQLERFENNCVDYLKYFFLDR